MQLKVQVFVVDGGTTVRAVREVVGATPLVFTLVIPLLQGLCAASTIPAAP